MPGALIAKCGKAKHVSPMPFGWVGFDAGERKANKEQRGIQVSNAFRLGGL